MKSQVNDFLKKSDKLNKKLIIKRKNNSIIINNQDLQIHKANHIKNSKKIIKCRLNSTKEIKNGVKKAFNSKLCFNSKISSLNGINLQTINNRNIKNTITPPKKTKIRIIKKKDSKHQRNNKSIGNIINEKLKKDKNLRNSFSTGISTGTQDREKIKNIPDSEENNERININNFNYNADSHTNKLETILFEEKINNINNFSYETISKEDSNDSDKKIILKCDNYSLLTFGNSFSYSNSQKRKTNKGFLNNENDKNNNKNNNKDINNKESIDIKNQPINLVLDKKNNEDNKVQNQEKNMVNVMRKSAKPNLIIKIKKKKKKKSMPNPNPNFKENEGSDITKEENENKIMSKRQSSRPFGDIKFGLGNKNVKSSNNKIKEQSKNINGTTRRELLIDKKFLK
jgi:hypothetical protein